MNTALTMTAAETTPTPTDNLESTLEAARSLVETVQTTLEGLDGKAKNDVAGALANLLNAVAKRIEG